jgi:surfactin synthase thioesterase subunit
MNTTPLSDDWIRRYHPRPDAAVRLVCFPHAGGSAPFYFPVSAAAGPDVEVLSVQYPGRQDRRTEPFIENIDELADALAEVLTPWLDRPFAFFGHSMGATVAFEVARRCEARGLVPLHLFVSGRRAPSRTRDEHVHERDDAGLIADLVLLSGTDTRIFGEPELMGLVLPAIRNDYKAAETYVYREGEPLRCPITVLIGDDDPKSTVDEAESWRDHTTGATTAHVYPGGHFYLVEHKDAVLDVISRALPVPIR